MSKFLPASGFKWIDSKEFGLIKHTNNISKGCVLEVDLEYPKEIRELHNDYCRISIDNIKKLVPNFCEKENM